MLSEISWTQYTGALLIGLGLYYLVLIISSYRAPLRDWWRKQQGR